MSEQDTPPEEKPADEPTPEQPEAQEPEAQDPEAQDPEIRQPEPSDLNRRQHLAAALRGRPVVIAAAAITALAVGLGGFGVGYAVGHDGHGDRGERFGRIVFERGELPDGPGDEWRGFAPPGSQGALPEEQESSDNT